MASGSRIVKVFCDPDRQRELARVHECKARYEGFAVFRMTPRERDRLARDLPVEDITKGFGIRVGRRTIDTSRPRVVPGGDRPHPFYRGVARLSTGRHHYLVQFVGPIKPAWLARIRRLRGELREPFSDFAWICRCTAAAARAISAEPMVRWVGHLPHRSRLEISSRRLPRTRNLAGVYTLELFGRDDLRRARAQVRRAGAVLLHADERSGTMTVRIEGRRTARVLDRLSGIHGVRAVRRRAIRRISNDIAIPIMGGTPNVTAPGGLTGAGEVVAICDTGLDTGDPKHMHPDFAGRVRAIRSYPVPESWRSWVHNVGADDGPADFDSGHGTHVAGSAVGSGAGGRKISGQRRIRGFAFRAGLVFQAVEQEVVWRKISDFLDHGRFALAGIPDDITPLLRFAYDRGARIHSNSWGGGDPGEYDAQCRQLDAFVWSHPDFCVLVAAGNDGTDVDASGRADGVIDPMSVTSPATAKNCITVGASENVRRDFDAEQYGAWWEDDYPRAPYRTAAMASSARHIVAFSSRGPTRDGRIKPELVAPGTFVLSSRSRVLSPDTTGWAPFTDSRLYFHLGGTSMATPLAAGAAAVVREFLRKRVGYRGPSAALVRACLVVGAERLPTPRGEPRGPVSDNAQGFGRVNVRAIAAPGPGLRAHFIDDRNGISTGQVDEHPVEIRSSRRPLRVALAYSDYPGPALVNDVNLALRAPDGRLHVGNGRAGGALRFDRANNTEVVEVRRPARGTWTVRVIASNVPRGPQEYALALLGPLR